MQSDCVEPYCNFSKYRNKCIRANSYIEAIAWCKRNKKNHKECKNDYNLNKKEARDLACNRYYERLNFKKKPSGCQDPKCHFSKYRNKCVKPNPYVEKLAYCGRIKKNRPECEGDYKEDKVEAKLNACKRYRERIALPKKIKYQKVKKPVIKSPSPPSPLVKSPSPVIKSPSPVIKSPSPVIKSPSPVIKSPSPVIKSPSPLVKSPSPLVKSPSPLVKSPSPLVKSPSPVIKSPSPLVKSSPRISNKLAIKIASSSKKYSSPPKKSSSYSESRKRKINEFKLKMAAKKIQKLAAPFINRVSADINDRVINAKLLIKYLSNINPMQCLTTIGDNQYSIADGKVKLMKQIGSESEYGVIYKSKGVNEGELFRFASKIMKDTRDNTNEVEVLNKISKIVLDYKNPHFPIMYKNLLCLNKNSDPKLPKLTQKNNYYINLNEYANGDLKMFMRNTTSHSAKYDLNAIAQIYLSILSFHNLGYYHNDSHYGNFLFHRIKSGGYINYNIFGQNVYLENIGFLWVIWDFGLVKKYVKNYTYEYLEDYCRIINAFLNESDRFRVPIKGITLTYEYFNGWIENIYPISIETKNMVKKITDIIVLLKSKRLTSEKGGEIELFNLFINSTNLFLKTLPPGAKVINSNPYIIR